MTKAKPPEADEPLLQVGQLKVIGVEYDSPLRMMGWIQSAKMLNHSEFQPLFIYIIA